MILVNGFPWLGYWERDKKEAIFLEENFQNNIKLIELNSDKIDGIWILYSDKIKKISKKFQLYVVVPNIGYIVRSLNQDGIIKTGMKRIFGLNFASLAKIGFWNIKNADKLARKDFETILIILTDLDICNFGRKNIKMIFLDSTITDMAVANNNFKLLNSWILHVKEKYNIGAGLCTKDFDSLIGIFDSGKLNTNIFAAPFYLNKKYKKRNDIYLINTNPFANNTLMTDKNKMEGFDGYVLSINNEDDAKKYLDDLRM